MTVPENQVDRRAVKLVGSYAKTVSLKQRLYEDGRGKVDKSKVEDCGVSRHQRVYRRETGAIRIELPFFTYADNTVMSGVSSFKEASEWHFVNVYVPTLKES